MDNKLLASIKQKAEAYAHSNCSSCDIKGNYSPCVCDLLERAYEAGAKENAGHGMRWVNCSDQLPDTYDQHEQHYRVDGKRSNGYLVESANGGVVFEHRPGARYEIIIDLTRVEWLDEDPN